MTDKIYALTVVFDEPLNYDTAHRIADAILMMRHVIRVQEEVADVNTYAARESARTEYWNKIVEALKE